MTGSQRRKILVVEDDAALVKVLRTLLESAGYEVRAEGRGSSALSCVSNEQPDLVILDLGLPDMDGNEVCRRLRQFLHPWAMPILILTARAAASDQLRGFAHGADAYVTKPFDVPELLKTIALLLGEPEQEFSRAS
ncbi:MAG: response regulator [Candidatus Rokubacteria bacterium]|nr:response regulator [Candidatus Rokubacteria bacterium]